MGNTKNWRPTAPPKIDIHLDEVPQIEMKLFCLSLARMCEEYLKDPKHRAECDEWVRTHCKEENVHEQ